MLHSSEMKRNKRFACTYGKAWYTGTLYFCPGADEQNINTDIAGAVLPVGHGHRNFTFRYKEMSNVFMPTIPGFFMQTLNQGYDASNIEYYERIDHFLGHRYRIPGISNMILKHSTSNTTTAVILQQEYVYYSRSMYLV